MPTTDWKAHRRMANPAKLAAAALGEGLVTGSPQGLQPFVLDGRLPRAAAFPETPEQVADLMALAQRERWAVVPWGGGSGAGHGNPPARYDLALSLSRLAAVVEHDRDNLTLTAQAGATVGEVNRQTRAARQHLPLGVAGDRGTLGGVIAADRPVTRRLAHGDVRDLLLGVRVALPGGRLVRYGRKVIKNVAGYDMNKLFLGSQGIYGVLVEAIFKLAALPDEEGFLLGGFANGPAAAGAASALLASQLEPACVFLLDPAAGGVFCRRLAVPPPGEGTLLLAGFQGRAATLRRQLDDGRKLLLAAGAIDLHPLPALSPQAEAHLGVPGLEEAETQAPVLLRVGVPISQVAPTMERLGGALRSIGLASCAVADFSAGSIRVAVDAPENGPPEAPAKLAELIAAVREELAPQRGFVALHAAPPNLKERVDVWGDLGGEPKMMARLKARIDPNDILAPGRFLPEVR